ncbi:MAG: excinuclease ABC subunit UvrC [Holosporales bacterium]|jgi:excinuclease ABC subunit C|nr:excinuclease ABC subunit UvrC [Holosporales bacterium]
MHSIETNYYDVFPDFYMQKASDIMKLIMQVAQNAGMNPGIYKMLNCDGKVVYVGKAKHLKKRLLSYTKPEKLHNRTRVMISNIATIEYIVVNSETEALLLENNLIKQLKPTFNILLKDDKTFPCIVIDTKHNFPRLFKCRTSKTNNLNFFGPYPNTSALEETIKIIQKSFFLRTCSDTYFSTRTRPCLQYFIKKCSAPCVNKISKEVYGENVNLAFKFLAGEDKAIRQMLLNQMDEAAKSENFEKAAIIRDRISALSTIQSKQYIQIKGENNINFVAFAEDNDAVAVAITFFKIGQNVGTETYLLEKTFEHGNIQRIFELFICQFYKNVVLPSVIVTNCNVTNSEQIEDFLNITYGSKPKICHGNRGIYKKIIATCELNAKTRLTQAKSSNFESQIAKLCKLVGLSNINRIECYDNSHIHGENACTSMVVFENGKMQRGKTVKFNIDRKIAAGGNDITMLRYSIEKRLKSKNIPSRPDLMVIDGGMAQLAATMDVISKFDLSNKIKAVAIAKQNNRKIGYEKIILENGDEKTFSCNDELLLFLIMLRNEAHKVAISFHRKKRRNALSKSTLDNIKFIGHVRKMLLLQHFGSIENIKNASIEDLKMVKSINDGAAESIFKFFNRAWNE